jgi:hypothetical protein
MFPSTSHVPTLLDAWGGTGSNLGFGDETDDTLGALEKSAEVSNAA